mgnify:CR=1 FL=1
MIIDGKKISKDLIEKVKDEVSKIRSYVTNLDDRVIGTYHPDINDGVHDPNGGHNLAQHIQWHSKTDEYGWFHNKIMKWIKKLKLPIEYIGSEFIVQKYNVGFEFKPHIDDVLAKDKKSLLKKRYYTILLQLSDTSEYSGGELWVRDNKDIKVNQEIGNVCIFDHARLHWVTPITSGEKIGRASCRERV